MSCGTCGTRSARLTFWALSAAKKNALRTRACAYHGSVCAFVRLCDTGARMVPTVPTPRYHGSGLFGHDARRGQNHETEAADPFGPTVHGLHRPDPGRSDPPDRTLGRPRSHRQPWVLCRGYFRGSPRSLRCSYRIGGEFYSVKQHAP